MACCGDERDLKCTGLGKVVLTFAVINLVVKAVVFMIPVVSTVAMVVQLVSGNVDRFDTYLNHESNRAIWKGPYPDNFLETRFYLTSTNFDKPTEWNVLPPGSEIVNASSTGGAILEFQGVQRRINLHVWSRNVLLKCMHFIFAWVLLFAVKKKSYVGCLVWISFSLPVFIENLLELVMDLLLGDFFLWQWHSQVLQCVDVCLYQLVGILLTASLIRQLYSDKKPAFRRSGTYLPFQVENDVTVREIVSERY